MTDSEQEQRMLINTDEMSDNIDDQNDIELEELEEGTPRKEGAEESTDEVFKEDSEVMAEENEANENNDQDQLQIPNK